MVASLAAISAGLTMKRQKPPIELSFRGKRFREWLTTSVEFPIFVLRV